MAERTLSREKKYYSQATPIKNAVDHCRVTELHEYSHQEKTQKKPIISRRWQIATIAGNAVIGAAELVTGGGSTLSVTADGMHNAGDAATYYLQTENILNKKLREDRIEKRRKIAHAIIASLSLSVAAKAGYDLSSGDEVTHNPATLYSASASLALNALLVTTLYKGIYNRKRNGTLSAHEKDLTKHLWAIDVPSAALAVGGAVAQKYGVDYVEPIAAVASGVVGAYAFRPTAKNLEHDTCVKHDHSHHGHGHGHNHKDSISKKKSGRHRSGIVKDTNYIGKHREKKNTDDAEVLVFSSNRARKRRQALASVALVAALGSGVSSSTKFETLSDANSSEITISSEHTQMSPDNEKSLFEKPLIFEPEFTISVPVSSGDTQWEMVEDAIVSANITPSNELVNVITDMTAYENQVLAPNPDLLQAGQTLNIPSQATINAVQEVLENPQNNSTLASNLRELNDAPSMSKWEKIKSKANVLQNIKTYFASR